VTVFRSRVSNSEDGSSDGRSRQFAQSSQAKARADRSAQAAGNRARFGRALAERRLVKSVELKRARELDGRRLESRDDS